MDFVLAPESIAAELARVAERPWSARGDTDPSPEDEAALRELFVLLHRAIGVDFSTYRQSTVRRRIQRRMALHPVRGLVEFTQLLKTDPGEVEALCRDILIQVTRFFRDPDAFATLQATVVPDILRATGPTEPIRVWVPGCATGEEAYSIAIVVRECMDAMGRRNPVQIFATDLSAPAIAIARAGAYAGPIEAEVSAERLERYFTRVGEGYQVTKAIREMCVFAEHDLIGDPPFSRMHLISCRNVLIYLSAIQPRILALFHYALLPEGFLLLGSAETAASVTELFAPVDGKSRVFRRRNTLRTSPPRLPAPSRAAVALVDDAGAAASVGRATARLNLRSHADRLLLSRYVPAAVLADEHLDVIETRGQIEPYLQHPPGRVRLGLLRMARRSGLSSRIAGAIREARASGAAVRSENVPFVRDGEPDVVNVEVVPLGAGPGALWLVLFEPSTARAEMPSPPAVEPDAARVIEEKDQRIRDLQRELADVRDQISELIEEHEERLEESQSAAEEALSNSEELQSINEELETTKEELEATNEELATINAELESRNTELQRAQDFTNSIVATVPEPLLVLAGDLIVKSANRSYFDFAGTSPAETIGRTLFDLGGGTWNVPLLRSELAASHASDELFSDLELTVVHASGSRRTVMLTARRFRGLDLILLAIQDVTVRRASERVLHEAEEHLREMQKMEAIGRLAGGVAHDFNNVLTVLMGYADVLLERLDASDPSHADVQEIRSATERAASITRQLLAFSRRQVMQLRLLDLNVVAADMGVMLRRLIGENIDLTLRPAPEPAWVRADPGQIGQIVLNLVLNARDAIGTSGSIDIAIGFEELSEAQSLEQGMPAGRHVTLSVADTGCGMDAATHARCFEPFFTTKPPGEGTGLGLATVHGIAEQSGGWMRSRTTLGAGSVFTLHLPREEASSSTPARAATREAGGMPKGDETILLVEDEEPIRRLGRLVLSGCGYHVLEARNGREALDACERHAGAIQLVVTDVVMPEMGGRELVERLLRLRPELRVLYVSGYTEDAVLKRGVQMSGTPFLQKPFTPLELAHRVRDVLDADHSPAG